jgi:predicted MFS family arabinose efflux permease
MKTSFLTKIALVSAGWCIFSDSVIVPLISSIMQEFPDASPILMNFVISGGALVALLTGLVAGMLANRFNLKYLLLGTTFIFTTAGVLGFLSPNLEFLAVMRAIDGAMDGFNVVLVATAIIRLFPDEQERNQLLGWNWAVLACFGILMSFLSGLIAVNGWRPAFLVNLISLFAPIMVLIFVPSMPVSRKTESKQSLATEAVLPKDNRPFPYQWMIFAVIAYFIFNVLFNYLWYLIDPYIVERGLGNSVVSGTLSSIATAGTIPAGILFGTLFKKTKKIFPTLFYLLGAVSMLFLYFPVGIVVVGIVVFTASVAFAFSMPYYQAAAADRVPAHKIAPVMSYLNVSQCLGLTLAAYVPILFGKVFGTESMAETFGIIFIMLALISLAYFIAYLIQRRRESQNPIAS